MSGMWVAAALCVSLLIPVLVEDQDQSLYIEMPTSMIAFIGINVTFRCQSIGDYVTWRVNGTLFNNLENTSDISASVIPRNRGPALSLLFIQASKMNNNTVIQCVTMDIQDNKSENSSEATLTVQGTLVAVGGLTAVPKEGSLHLTWSPPFSLNVTNMTTYIHYCINIYNITNSQHDLLNTSCDILQPEFEFTITNPSPCDQFKFQVIPVNAAGNGTSSNISGYLFSAPTLPTAPTVGVAIYFSEIIADFSFSETFHICTWRVYVNSSDDLAIQSLQVPNTRGGTSTTGFNFTIQSDILPFDQNYSIAIEGENSAGRALSPKFQMSTFDVQRTLLTSDHGPGRLNLTCVFALHSLALGCLSIIGGKSSTAEKFYVVKKTNNTILVEDLDSDNYTVVTFDIEHSGLPGNRSAYIEDVEIQNELKMESDNNSADIDGTVLESFNNGTLCLNCQFLSGCIVLVHSISIPHQLGVHTTQGAVQTCVNASICTRSNCVVAVFEQSRDGIINQAEPVLNEIVAHLPTGSPVHSTTSKPATDTLPFTVRVVASVLSVSVLLLVTVVVTVVVVFILKMKKKKGHSSISADRSESSTSSNQDLKNYQDTKQPDTDVKHFTGKSTPFQQDKEHTSPPLTNDTQHEPSKAPVVAEMAFLTTAKNSSSNVNTTPSQIYPSPEIQGQPKEVLETAFQEAPLHTPNANRPKTANSTHNHPSQIKPNKVLETAFQEAPLHTPNANRPKTANSTHNHPSRIKPNKEVHILDMENDDGIVSEDLSHPKRPQTASERDKKKGEHSGSRTQVQEIFPRTPPRLAWGDDTV